MVTYSAPWEIADRSKIVLLSIDGHFDPRKMPSGRGVGKNMKIEWTINAKIEGFWWLRTMFGVILFAYFTLLPFSEKKERKINAKRDPKSCAFRFKNWSWAPQGGLILQFFWFLMIFGDPWRGLGGLGPHFSDLGASIRTCWLCWLTGLSIQTCLLA